VLIVINISTSLSPRCRRGEMPTLQVYSQGCFFLYPGRSAQRALPRQLEISVQSPSSLSESHWIALNLRTEYENAVLSFAKTQPPTVACRLGVARCLRRSRRLAASRLYRRSRLYGTTPGSALPGGPAVSSTLYRVGDDAPPLPGGVGRRTGVVHGVAKQ